MLKKIVVIIILGLFLSQLPLLKIISPQIAKADALSQSDAQALVDKCFPGGVPAQRIVIQSAQPEPIILVNGCSSAVALLDFPTFHLKTMVLSSVPTSTSVVGVSIPYQHSFWFQGDKHPELWMVFNDRGDGAIVYDGNDGFANLKGAAQKTTGSNTKGTESYMLVYGGATNSFKADESSFNDIILHRSFNDCSKKVDPCVYDDTSTYINKPDIGSTYGMSGAFPVEDAAATSENSAVLSTCDDSGHPGKGGENCNTHSWIDSWGVTYLNLRAQKGCTMSDIMAAALPIVGNFEKLVDCLISSVFKPMVLWASAIVKDAAGLSYNPDPEDKSPPNLQQRPPPAKLSLSSFFIGQAHAAGGSTITGLAKDIPNTSGFVYQGWGILRGLINVVLILVLLLLSFTNIVRFNISSYEVKQALPKLLIGILLANASFIVIRYLVDIVTVVTQFFSDMSGVSDFGAFITKVAGILGASGIKTVGSVLRASPQFVFIIVIIYALVIIILFLWLAFLLYVRLAVIYLLTILAPVAMICYGVPGADKYFKQWWGEMVKWLFMVPAIAAVFYLIVVINGDGSQQSAAKLILMIVIFVFGCTMPTKIGGKVMTDAAGIFKKYSGINAAQKYGSDAWKDTKERAGLHAQQSFYSTPLGKRFSQIKQKRDLDKENLKASIANLHTDAKKDVLSGTSGLIQAQNAQLAETLKEEEAAIVAGQGEKVLNQAGVSEGFLKAQWTKQKAEASKKRILSEKKLAFILDESNAENKKLLNGVFEALNREKVATEESSLQENIASGNFALSDMQLVRAADNWKKLDDEIIAEKDPIRKNELQHRQLDIKKAYDNRLAQGDTLDNEFRGTSIEELSRKMNDKSDIEGKLWEARLKQERRIVNEGITKQNELDLREGSADQFRGEFEKYLEDLNTKFSPEASKLFLQGRTAELETLMRQKDPSLTRTQLEKNTRDGLLVTNKYKTVLRNASDIRHAQMAGDYAKIYNKYNTDPNQQLAPDIVNKAGSANRAERIEAVNEMSKISAPFVGAEDTHFLASVPIKAPLPSTPVPSTPAPTPPPRPAMPTYSQADLDQAPGRGQGTAPDTQEAYAERYKQQHGIDMPTPEEWDKKYKNDYDQWQKQQASSQGQGAQPSQQSANQTNGNDDDYDNGVPV